MKIEFVYDAGYSDTVNEAEKRIYGIGRRLADLGKGLIKFEE